MKAPTTKSPRVGGSTRPLAPRDIDTVIGIDAALSGRSRRAYFERRAAAARRDPGRHIQFVVEQDGALAGFMLGCSLEGEFGRSAPALRMEALGVKPGAQGRGLGALLAAAFESEALRRGLREIRTAATWREHALLGFLDRAGYRLGANHVLDCALGTAELGSPRERAVPPSANSGDSNDYGAWGRDFDSVARDTMDIGLLTESDHEGIARIDRRLTGRDRSAYLRSALARTLADSALRVSLAARVNGSAAGFLMAQVDYGDFGRAEPVAVIDTIGVDPLRKRQGIGRALLSQLFINLAALGVERIETVVAPGDLDLLGFFHDAGLLPSERLAFVKPLA